MESLDEKSNNEILFMIKQFQAEHEAVRLSMVKDHDAIEALKERMKKNWAKMEKIEADFAEANAIIVRRLKGEV